jgi:hypothetical protein
MGKSLIHDSERAPLVRRTFEDYATGQYTKEQLLKRARAWGLTKESVLQIWKARKAAVHEEIATAERATKVIQEKLDRLDEAFLFDRSI